MKPSDVVVWIEVGGRLVRVGVAAFEAIRGVVHATSDEDTTRLQDVQVGYEARIARREGRRKWATDEGE